MVDRYTKAVLTVIAVALVWLCVKSAAPASPAWAASGPVEVVVVNGRTKPVPVEGSRVSGALAVEGVTLGRPVRVEVVK